MSTDTVSSLIRQIRDEIGEYLPKDWDDEDLIIHALRFLLANGDAIEQDSLFIDEDWESEEDE